MGADTTVAERILQFNEQLEGARLEVPTGFAVVNPFAGPSKESVRAITSGFYRRFYNDQESRRLVLGSSPARRGTAVTGVPFADAQLLESESGTTIGGYSVSRGSAGFLDEVVARYGGRERFYADFIMNFVCPLGLVKKHASGRETNANYYENKTLLNSLRVFIVDTLRQQIAIGADTSVCYCIGSGGNFKFLHELNTSERLFGRVVPLEHPRYIAQYNPTKVEDYVDKYLTALGANEG